MPLQTIKLSSFWGGESASPYFFKEGQYLKGIGIDVDFPVSDSVGDRLSSGAIRPTAYADFSSTGIDATPLFWITQPKTNTQYSIQSNGKIYSYNSSFASETSIGQITGSACNGAAYYNNYLYVAGTTDISRYGPLDGSPSLANTFWTVTLGKTALSNTTYPGMRGSVALPNHAMCVHSDGNLYFLDYDSTTSTAGTRGKGLVHKISTTFSSTEGTGNDASAYNVLDLPYNMMPTCIESYGTDLVIGCIQGTDGNIKQGTAFLFFWDTLSDNPYAFVELPDPLVTGLKFNNGVLWVFTGNISTGTDAANGYRVLQYAGGYSLKQLYYSNTGQPPLTGAITANGNRVSWGTFDQVQTTTAGSPTYYGVVKSLNSKDPNLPSGVHTVAKMSAAATAADGVVTSLAQVEQSSLSKPRYIMGWRNASDFGIDKITTTYGTSVFQSPTINIGKKFIIRRIRMNFVQAVGANMTLTPTVFLDDFSSSNTTQLTVVNNTNYANSERHVEYLPDIVGDHSFCLDLTFTGTALLTVLPGIEIDIETINDF